jgi:hypothetical protein
MELKALAIIEKAVDNVDEGQGISRLIDDAVSHVFKKVNIKAIMVLWPNGYEDLRAQIDAYVSEPEEAMLSDYDMTYMKDREDRLKEAQ